MATIYWVYDFYWWCPESKTQITFYVYCTWQVKTGYTPSRVLLAHRLVLDYRQQHTSMNRHTFPQLIGSYIYGQTKDCFGSTKYYDNIGNYDVDVHPKIPLVIPKNKDSNNAVCAHFAWSIQTGYIPPQGNADPQAGPWFWESACLRSAKYNWYCQQQHLQQLWQFWNALVMLKIKDSNDAVYAHYTWSVQNWVYTPPGRTPTHRSVLYFKQQHTCSNRPAILYTYGYVHWHIQ